MKLCKDCKYYKTTVFGIEQFCQSPNNGISLVNGKPKQVPIVYRTDPVYSNVCGEEGAWFVQRKPFWKFWS
jgi:hypothetical protein